MPKVSPDRIAATKGQILDGARRCFAEHGYDGATVRLLEAATGLSRGAIFHHYQDKAELFFALAKEDDERMAQLAASHGLVQVMRNLLRRPEELDWLTTRLEITRRLRTEPEFRERWTHRSTAVREAALARLARKQNDGGVRDDIPVEVLYEYLQLMLDGLVSHLASGEETARLEAVLDMVETAIRVPNRTAD
ncbi:transcriptional regulator, TetR family [Segniliparus rotundus DSM 44985]|uniref:Transcriptional regulator, TetR family n=1 Tax=Segniliparus rotundus (strain ATCC BAA-972 / CDC 1076 / CIP 108378 / DSM 44985 / JCM 13578) TaxID=640132 RepID=D6Z7K5_SEGRD|nr:TetR/AcrR family transcriptional regulator [Segniliparus rotundus]ADG97935.1 transcriptional regulator, TetR family [Segniliparus rotundus DSM 44985]